MSWVEMDGAGESWVHGLVIVIDFIRKNVLDFIPFLKKYVFIIWICYNHSLEVKDYFQQHMTEREMQKGYIYTILKKRLSQIAMDPILRISLVHIIFFIFQRFNPCIFNENIYHT